MMTILCLLGQLLAEMRYRHDRGLYAVACDWEANEHYGDPNHGVPAALYRLHRYGMSFARRT